MPGKTIWKYEIPDAPIVTLSMPKGAQLLSVQPQRGAPMLWALVDPKAEKEKREFHVVGTGCAFEPDGLTHVGTFQIYDVGLVFHLFEVVTR